MIMYIDCFSFFNELDLLEIRLNSLAPYVDRFVLSECPVTHTGKPKHLYFEENKDRFRDFNITHLIVSGYQIGRSPWKIEKYQREYLMNGVMDVDPECIILLSDVDEIPDLEANKNGTGTFTQKLYYYYLNTYTGNSSSGTVAIRKKDITTLNYIKTRRIDSANRIYDGGWHFSTLAPVGNIIDKIESFAHHELNTPNIKNKISENLDNLVDPYNRNSDRFKIEMPSGPKWLLDNKDKYDHLFYKGINNDCV